MQAPEALEDEYLSKAKFLAPELSLFYTSLADTVKRIMDSPDPAQLNDYLTTITTSEDIWKDGEHRAQYHILGAYAIGQVPVADLCDEKGHGPKIMTFYLAQTGHLYESSRTDQKFLFDDLPEVKTKEAASWLRLSRVLSEVNLVEERECDYSGYVDDDMWQRGLLEYRAKIIPGCGGLIEFFREV